jgi:hypothetical protein
MRKGGRLLARVVMLLAVLPAAVGCALHAVAEPGVLGDPPSYGPHRLSVLPNAGAIGARIWMPGLDAGYDPQGLAVVHGDILVSAYRSDGLRQSRGPCRVFRLDPATGRQTGAVDVPPPCGHAGGLGYLGGDAVYLTDTHTLFEIPLADFAGGAASMRAFPLGAGLTGALAAGEADGLWIGSYETDGPGRIFKFPKGVLAGLQDGQTLERQMAVRALPIPSYAQGAAVAADGALWVARSSLSWASLDVVDLTRAAVVRRYAMPGGLEGIAFDRGGGLWGVSEAGSRHIYDFPLSSIISPFNPLVFRVDTGALQSE